MLKFGYLVRNRNQLVKFWKDAASVTQTLYVIQNKKRKTMKEYKVETLVYYSKLTLDSEHIATKSNKEIQEKLDEYATTGYTLTSTTSTNFGLAFYIYLFFEKDV